MIDKYACLQCGVDLTLTVQMIVEPSDTLKRTCICTNCQYVLNNGDEQALGINQYK